MDPYIEHFEASGTVTFLRDSLQRADELPDFFTFIGSYIGIGAARKMNCGRFEVKDWAFSAP